MNIQVNYNIIFSHNMFVCSLTKNCIVTSFKKTVVVLSEKYKDLIERMQTKNRFYRIVYTFEFLLKLGI